MSSYCKFYKEKKQVSYDNGITWSDVVPAEYRKGELIQSGSTDCESGSTGYSTQYLTFVAVSAGTFSFEGTSSSTINNSSIQYSVDNGSTWYTLNRGVQSPTISAGQKIMWKSQLSPVSDGIGRFSSSQKYNVEGNAMSLLYGDNFQNKTSFPSAGLNDLYFANLFSGSTKLISAENLVLPATTLKLGCYEHMFDGCTSLTSTPSLPATTLAEYCYNYMFAGCSSLTTVPSNMLPVTNLVEGCYQSMFQGCSSLATAPLLPATTLAEYCYSYMFAWCSSLTTAPELSATTLVDYCFWGIFIDCASLNYIKCLATNISATDCTFNWVNGVASSGTFVKNSSMSSWTTGISGIPSNWSVQNA